jgi:hypothetical protein
VDAMLESMSSAQFTAWMQYYGIEPFGHSMMDVHFATIESILANANRAKGKPAVQPKDFLLSKPSLRQNAHDLYARLKSWALRSKE